MSKYALVWLLYLLSLDLLTIQQISSPVDRTNKITVKLEQARTKTDEDFHVFAIRTKKLATLMAKRQITRCRDYKVTI